MDPFGGAAQTRMKNNFRLFLHSFLVYLFLAFTLFRVNGDELATLDQRIGKLQPSF